MQGFHTYSFILIVGLLNVKEILFRMRSYTQKLDTHAKTHYTLGPISTPFYIRKQAWKSEKRNKNRSMSITKSIVSNLILIPFLLTLRRSEPHISMTFRILPQCVEVYYAASDNDYSGPDLHIAQ